MARMVMITKGTGGDLFPFLRIGTLLQARGHDVILMTHGPYEDRVRRAGLEFVALDRNDEFEQLVEAMPVLHRPQEMIRFYQNQIRYKQSAEVALIRQQCRTGETVLITHFNSYIAAREATELLDVPLVSVFLAPIYLLGIPILEQALATFAVSLNGHRTAHGLPPVHDWHSWLRGSARSIAFWPDWFAAPNATWPPGVAQVGFMLNEKAETGDVDEAADAISNQDAPPVLITHATSHAIEMRFFEASAEACRSIDRAGILVTPHRELVPSLLPKQVRWFPYLPFSRLMPRMAAVIHHGGIGTLAQALAAGVPQLVLPAGFDRPENAARLQDLGVAEFLPPPRWRADDIAAALQRLIVSAVVREHCQELAGRFKGNDPASAACTVIEETLLDRATHLSKSDVVQAKRTDSALPGEASREPGDVSERLRTLSPERRAFLMQRLAEKDKQTSRDQPIPKQPRSWEAPPVPPVATARLRPRASIEQVLAQTFGRMAGTGDVDIHAPFPDWHGSSAQGEQFAKQVNEIFAIRLFPQRILEASSIIDLAEGLVAREAVPGQVDAIARLYLRIEKESNLEITPPVRDAVSGAQAAEDRMEEIHTWVSPVFDLLGYADEARNFLLALDAAGYRFAVAPIQFTDKLVSLPPEAKAKLLAMVEREIRPGGIHVNHHFVPSHFVRRSDARLNVGRIMFETDRLPEGWAQACNRMDRIWVPSEFNRETFVRGGVATEKIRVVPETMDFAPYDPSVPPLTIGEVGGFNFLSVFEWIYRKGWDVLLQAYLEEFSADEDVCLIIKTHSAQGYSLEQMLQMAQERMQKFGHSIEQRRPNIIFYDKNLPAADMPRLYRASDCFVLPTRGEGWGRPFMEAMAMGLPTIGTNWSGHTAFMTASNSYLLDFQLAPVSESAYGEMRQYRGHWWAEPDVSHLRYLMRHVFTNSEEARAVGARARADVTTSFSYERVAATIGEEMAH